MIDIKILEIGLVNHGEICGIFKAIKNHKNVNDLTGPRMFDLSKSEILWKNIFNRYLKHEIDPYMSGSINSTIQYSPILAYIFKV